MIFRFTVLYNNIYRKKKTKKQKKTKNTVNLSCSCALETESTEHFFLRCQNYVSLRTALRNELSSIDCEIVSLRPSLLLEVILYNDKMLNDKSNHRILTATKETVRSCVCIVFFLYFIFIASSVSEYNVHYYYRKKYI